MVRSGFGFDVKIWTYSLWNVLLGKVVNSLLVTYPGTVLIFVHEDRKAVYVMLQLYCFGRYSASFSFFRDRIRNDAGK